MQDNLKKYREPKTWLYIWSYQQKKESHKHSKKTRFEHIGGINIL